MNPGLEPILLDLEKLFLLSDEGNSRNYYIEQLKPYDFRNYFKTH